MAKVFYDRSGKAHTIGRKTEGAPEKKSEERSKSPAGKPKGHAGAKKSFSAPSSRRPGEVRSERSRIGSNEGGESRGRFNPEERSKKFAPATRRSGGKAHANPNKRKHEGDPRFAGDDHLRQNRRDNRDLKGSDRDAGRDFGSRPERPNRKAEALKDQRQQRSRGERSAEGRGGRRARSFEKKSQKGHRGGGAGRGRDERSRYSKSSSHIDPNWIKLKGVIDKNKKGSAFLVFDRRDLEDLFIPRFFNEQLFHGDRVEVYVNEAGEIENLKVLEHRFKEIFGRVYFDERANDGFGKKKHVEERRSGYLVYERKKAREEIHLPSIPLEVKEGDWVKAEMVFDGEEGEGHVAANIVQIIGQMLPASFDIQMVAGEFNLTEHHTFDAVKQAESYTLEIPGKDEVGRTDLRHIPFMTIDGERARDFDDAVYVERTPGGGFLLWVAIADVSHYVKAGTPLDREAYARATSVYFPERAFHMLPRALSEELCSLKPKVPRLSMAVSIAYSASGEKGEIKLYDAIIESRRRATYTEIEAEKEDPKHADMFALYRILRAQRKDRGSIDFDFPESEIILDEKSGEPSDIVVRERNDAHRLIEEFMIGANEAVSEWMIERKMPFIYRIHEEPSVEAIEKFKKLAKNMGVIFNNRNSIPRPKVLADFIHQLKGHPAETVLATALLRSMRQAIYSATYGEHYGLASEAYTHFTSPIRRYPDLIVHRELREQLHREQRGEGRPSNEELEKIQQNLEESAEHCSYRERIASDAEREAIRFKQVRMMAKHVGDEFDGKVNGLMERGMFVQLHHPYCEGMISVESLGDDFYEFQEERMMLMGRKTRKTFQIGQPVRIRVTRVDLDTRQVEFQLLSSGLEKQVG